MGSKLASGEKKVLRYERDFVANPLAVGTEKLFDFPSNFVIESLRVLVVSAMTGTATLILGEDGGGDADGFCTDLVAGQSAGVSQRGEGALLYNSTDKRPLEHVVAAAKDGLLATCGTANIVAGKIVVFANGYQID